MIYCSLEDAWGKETFKNNTIQNDYQDSLSSKKNIKKDKRPKKNVEHMFNTKKTKEQNTCTDNENDYELDSIIDSDIEISDIENTDTPNDIFYSSKQNKNLENYIKKLQQQNIILKKKLMKLQYNRNTNNDFINSLLSKKNREVLILALCGIIIVILVHMITKN